MLIFVLIYSLAVSLSENFYPLIFASILPLILLLRSSKLPHEFLHINVFNFIMVLTLALTWPNFFDGLLKGLVISLRINFIFIIFSNFHDEIYNEILNLNLPEKIRILIILTLRGIFILRDKFDSALISLKLRAPDLHGILKFKTFAYILGSVLLQSSKRSENILKAINLRGGFNGFNQTKIKNISLKNSLLILYSFAVIILNYAY